MARSDIFHPDFQPLPYWWEAYAPAPGELVDVPREARVAIVGGGYAGLAPALLADAADAFSLIERLIEDEKIDCFWQKNGRFVGAWTPKHYAYQAQRLAGLNNDAQSGATMVPR